MYYRGFCGIELQLRKTT